ncbi:hypothetical protein MW887_002524 [Aspergillus wentii]|nr:hypothetical protein MW887_002524 [Aspergillus wentii]
MLGVGPKDLEFDDQGRPYGMKLSVQKGDVFVLPGILDSTNHRFDMNYALGSDPTGVLGDLSDAVPIPPLDPLYGLEGSLPRL